MRYSHQDLGRASLGLIILTARDPINNHKESYKHIRNKNHNKVRESRNLLNLIKGGIERESLKEQVSR